MNSCPQLDRCTCVTLWLSAAVIPSEFASAQQIIPFNLVQILEPDSTNEVDDSTKSEMCVPHVFIFGSTQLASSEEAFNAVSASGKFQAMILPSEKFGFTLAYNTFGVSPNTIAKDSLDVPTLVFPDAGNTGFMVAAFYSNVVGKHNAVSTTQSVTRITHYVEFSLRNTKIKPEYSSDNYETESTNDTSAAEEDYDVNATQTAPPTPGVLNFTSRNVNIGTRIDWLYVPKADPTQVVQAGVGVYVNYFSVPREDAKAFLDAIDKVYDQSISMSIKSLGFKTSFSYKGMTIFGDFRWNLSPAFDVANTPLEGFMFNVGTALNVELLKF
jgi:hypothetical protein